METAANLVRTIAVIFGIEYTFPSFNSYLISLFPNTSTPLSDDDETDYNDFKDDVESNDIASSRKASLFLKHFESIYQPLLDEATFLRNATNPEELIKNDNYNEKIFKYIVQFTLPYFPL